MLILVLSYALKLEHTHNYYLPVKLKENKIIEAPQVSQIVHKTTPTLINIEIQNTMQINKFNLNKV